MEKGIMTNNSVVRKIRFFTLCILLSACLVACKKDSAAQTDKEASKAEQQLKQICDSLTEDSKDGRVYESMIGQYLGSKSQTFEVGSSDQINHIIYFRQGEEETKIYESIGKEEAKRFFRHLHEVVGKHTIKDKKDTDALFGICAFKNYQKAYFGKWKTLRKIKIND